MDFTFLVFSGYTSFHMDLCWNTDSYFLKWYQVCVPCLVAAIMYLITSTWYMFPCVLYDKGYGSNYCFFYYFDKGYHLYLYLINLACYIDLRCSVAVTSAVCGQDMVWAKVLTGRGQEGVVYFSITNLNRNVSHSRLTLVPELALCGFHTSACVIPPTLVLAILQIMLVGD